MICDYKEALRVVYQPVFTSVFSSL